MMLRINASRLQTHTLASFGVRAFSTATSSNKKERVVVLGTGWGSMHFWTNLDYSKYDVTVVSPRNYFAFNPLLPSVVAGTLSPDSCMQPVRQFTHKKGEKVVDFYEATAMDIDVEKKKILCRHHDAYRGQVDLSDVDTDFEIPYDKLVVAVGCESNTFGIPGVFDNAYFLKEVEHARDVRKEVFNRFEKAAIPSLSESERKRLLHFLIVGGGPTGVETAAEISDLVRQDLAKVFPELMQYVQVSLVERSDKLVGMFHDPIPKETLDNLRRLKINVYLEHAVNGLTEHDASILDFTKDPKGVKFSLPYGLAVWCSGLAQVPFAKQLQNKIAAQKGKRVLTVDQTLKVKGTEDIFALGDCAMVEPSPLKDELLKLYRECAQDVSATRNRIDIIAKHLEKTEAMKKANTIEELTVATETAEKQYRSPAPTAQNARQAGTFLAEEFNQTALIPERKRWAFKPVWRGSVCYLGDHHIGMDFPGLAFTGGHVLPLVWKSIYLTMFLNMKGRFICAFDWVRVGLFGRSVGRDHLRQSKLKNPFRSEGEEEIKR